jgi:lysophospholipase L1-like esterase
MANSDLQPRVRRVLCAGDSITYGWGTSGVSAYPERLEALLNARDGSGWSVYNRGLSGDGTSGLLGRWNNGTNQSGPFIDEAPLRTLATDGWDTIVIMIGVNDISNGAPAVSVVANITALADDALELGARVVVCSITPWKGFALWLEERQTQQDAVSAQLAAWASEDPTKRAFVDTFAALEDPANPDAMLSAYDSGDHLHPGNDGAAAIASAVFAAF